MHSVTHGSMLCSASCSCLPLTLYHFTFLQCPLLNISSCPITEELIEADTSLVSAPFTLPTIFSPFRFNSFLSRRILPMLSVSGNQCTKGRKDLPQGLPFVSFWACRFTFCLIRWLDTCVCVLLVFLT